MATQSTISEIVTTTYHLDKSLPAWARRSHPIVRRQLGLYWRVLTPQIGWIFRWYLIQAGVLLVTILFPALLTPILMLILASLMLLPYAFVTYFKLLGQIIADSVTSITNEMQNDTIKLLRITPISPHEIVLSKAAASFWRRMEDIDTVITMWLFLGTPLVLLFQVLAWGPEEYGGLPQILTIFAMFTALIRFPLEAFMVSMLGMMIGTAARSRSVGIIGTASITFFYFLLTIMPRYIANLSLPVWIILEIVLPIVLPIVIITISMLGTVVMLTRD